MEKLLEQIIPPILVALLVAALGAGALTWHRANRNSEMLHELTQRNAKAIAELKAELGVHTDQAGHKILVSGQ